MRIQITTFAGIKISGGVLSIGGTPIRCAIPGCDVPVEFTLLCGRWFSAAGDLLEVKFYGAPVFNGTEHFVASAGVVAPCASAARLN
jgi:hypothetical protein